MTEFDDLCREAEDIDFETRCAILKGKSQEILPLLSEKSEDGGEILYINTNYCISTSKYT